MWCCASAPGPTANAATADSPTGCCTRASRCGRTTRPIWRWSGHGTAASTGRSAACSTATAGRLSASSWKTSWWTTATISRRSNGSRWRKGSRCRSTLSRAGTRSAGRASRRRRCCRSLRPIPTPPGPSTAIRCPSRRSICSTPPATTRRWAPTCCTPPRRTAGSCPMTVTPSLPARSARASSPPTTAGCGSPAWTPTPSRSSSWDAATT